MTVLRRVDDACRLIVGLAMLVMVASIFGQVFYRAMLDSYLGWAEETARFAFVWLVFLGSASAFKSRRHLGIDFLPELLGPKGRVALDSFLCIIVFVLMIVMAAYGYKMMLRTMTQSAPATGVTMGYIYMAMPISFALISVYAITDLIRNTVALAKGDLTRAAIQTQAGIVDSALKEDGA